MPIYIYNETFCLEYFNDNFPGYLTMATYSLKIDISYFNPNNELVSYLEVNISYFIYLYRLIFLLNLQALLNNSILLKLFE